MEAVSALQWLSMVACQTNPCPFSSSYYSILVILMMMMMVMVVLVMIEGTKGNWGRSEVAAPPIRVLGASAPGPWRYFGTLIFAPCKHMLTSFNADNAFNKRLLGGCDEERGFLLLP